MTYLDLLNWYNTSLMTVTVSQDIIIAPNSFYTYFVYKLLMVNIVIFFARFLYQKIVARLTTLQKSVTSLCKCIHTLKQYKTNKQMYLFVIRIGYKWDMKYVRLIQFDNVTNLNWFICVESDFSFSHLLMFILIYMDKTKISQ